MFVLISPVHTNPFSFVNELFDAFSAIVRTKTPRNADGSDLNNLDSKLRNLQGVIIVNILLNCPNPLVKLNPNKAAGVDSINMVWGKEGGLIEWCKDYLRNRQPMVVVHGETSDWLTVPRPLFFYNLH